MTEQKVKELNLENESEDSSPCLSYPDNAWGYIYIIK